MIKYQTQTPGIKTKIEINEFRQFGHVNKVKYRSNRIGKSVYNVKTQGKRRKDVPP